MIGSLMLAAGVPARGLYLKLNACAWPIARTASNVPWKSASVSPGKPTMKSPEMAMSGRAARTRSISFR